MDIAVRGILAAYLERVWTISRCGFNLRFDVTVVAEYYFLTFSVAICVSSKQF
jgi:hypothetical protein